MRSAEYVGGVYIPWQRIAMPRFPRLAWKGWEGRGVSTTTSSHRSAQGSLTRVAVSDLHLPSHQLSRNTRIGQACPPPALPACGPVCILRLWRCISTLVRTLSVRFASVTGNYGQVCTRTLDSKFGGEQSNYDCHDAFPFTRAM